MTATIALLAILGPASLTGSLGASARQAASATREEPVYDHETRVERWEDLRYPLPFAHAMVQGTVVVSATLDDEGRVVTATAVSGARSFIDAAVENLKKWKFTPNKKKRVVVIYEFSLDGRCNDNSQSLFRLKHANFVSVSGCMPLSTPAGAKQK